MIAEKTIQAVQAGKRRTARARLVLFAAVGIALFIVWSAIAWLAARALVVEEPVERSDALVVLSGSTVFQERARGAAVLFNQGVSSLIVITDDGILSGWAREQRRNPSFVERSIQELVAHGVPRDRIVVLPEVVSSTYDEAKLLREFSSAKNLRSLTIVTSAYHTRRSRWTFNRVFQGSGVKIGVQSPVNHDRTPPAYSWWIHGDGWGTVPLEYVKFVYYHIRY